MTTAEPCFIIIGAKQIQPWIARTPRLRLLRGASNALRVITHPDAIEAELATKLAAMGAEIDHPASAVDGVVVATVPDIGKGTEVATLLVDHLTAKLTGLPWEVWWGTASDPVSAVTKQKKDPHTAIAAAVQDIPFAVACETCRQEIARFRERIVDGSSWIGADCQVRLQYSDKDVQVPGFDDRPPTSVWQTVGGKWAKDFHELATKGGREEAEIGQRQPGSAVVGRHRSSNHVATICGDGNRLGDLFDALTMGGPEYADLRQTASDELNAVMTGIVERAAATLSRGAAIKVGLPHFVGGDDLLVSVRAEAAWQFVDHVLAGFAAYPSGLTSQLSSLIKAHRHLEGTPEHNRIQAALANVSLGIGVVFSHSSTPFDECQKVAHAALAVAKKTHKGARSAVCWVDLTEGSAMATDRVLTATHLAALLDKPPAGVAALPPSARSQLGQILGATTDERDQEAAVRTWWKRTQANREGVPAGIELEPVAELPAALSRARWWPSASEHSTAGEDASA